jgi:hypothetical protein
MKGAFVQSLGCEVRTKTQAHQTSAGGSAREDRAGRDADEDSQKLQRLAYDDQQAGDLALKDPDRSNTRDLIPNSVRA